MVAVYLSSFGTVLTKYHGMDILQKKKSYFLIVLVIGKSKIKVVWFGLLSDSR